MREGTSRLCTKGGGCDTGEGSGAGGGWGRSRALESTRLSGYRGEGMAGVGWGAYEGKGVRGMQGGVQG